MNHERVANTFGPSLGGSSEVGRLLAGPEERQLYTVEIND